MIRQDRLKISTLNEAQEQLGRRSLAQAVYDDCLDYYPLNGVERIRECVRTRLELNSLLQDEEVEKTIYHLCDVKWRDHGYLSIDNCSSAQVRYFQRTGEFRD